MLGAVPAVLNVFQCFLAVRQGVSVRYDCLLSRSFQVAQRNRRQLIQCVTYPDLPMGRRSICTRSDHGSDIVPWDWSQICVRVSFRVCYFFMLGRWAYSRSTFSTAALRRVVGGCWRKAPRVLYLCWIMVRVISLTLQPLCQWGMSLRCR